MSERRHGQAAGTAGSGDRPPVWGGLLVGGASRRMGTPKQLLEVGGVTLAERAAAALRPHVSGLVALGAGELPPSLDGVERLPDAALDGDRGGPPAGPLAGMLAALRWRPEAAWVVVPCDLPAVEPAAVEWLAGQRQPGIWAVLPRLGDGPPEPLLALYEPEARGLLEALAAAPAAGRAPHRLAGDPRVATPRVPAALARCWAGVNTPEELAGFERGAGGG